jgi:flagellin-like protein
MKKFIRKDDEAVSPVIAVILMVAITVVLAGVLWAMLSSMTGGGGDEAPKISISQPTEKSNEYVLSIAEVSGGSLTLSDAKFQLIDADKITKWEKFTGNANPALFTKSVSTVYALPSGAGAVNDGVNPVGSATNFTDYEDCAMAYIDGDSDGKVSAADSIHLYKDPDGDGTPDVSSNYVFKILKGKKLAGSATM